jgi:hypothetical protein
VAILATHPLGLGPISRANAQRSYRFSRWLCCRNDHCLARSIFVVQVPGVYRRWPHPNIIPQRLLDCAHHDTCRYSASLQSVKLPAVWHGVD